MADDTPTIEFVEGNQMAYFERVEVEEAQKVWEESLTPKERETLAKLRAIKAAKIIEDERKEIEMMRKAKEHGRALLAREGEELRMAEKRAWVLAQTQQTAHLQAQQTKGCPVCGGNCKRKWNPLQQDHGDDGESKNNTAVVAVTDQVTTASASNSKESM
jgi:hypothetical protein